MACESETPIVVPACQFETKQSNTGRDEQLRRQRSEKRSIPSWFSFCFTCNYSWQIWLIQLVAPQMRVLVCGGPVFGRRSYNAHEHTHCVHQFSFFSVYVLLYVLNAHYWMLNWYFYYWESYRSQTSHNQYWFSNDFNLKPLKIYVLFVLLSIQICLDKINSRIKEGKQHKHTRSMKFISLCVNFDVFSWFGCLFRTFLTRMHTVRLIICRHRWEIMIMTLITQNEKFKEKKKAGRPMTSYLHIEWQLTDMQTRTQIAWIMVL